MFDLEEVDAPSFSNSATGVAVLDEPLDSVRFLIPPFPASSAALVCRCRCLSGKLLTDEVSESASLLCVRLEDLSGSWYGVYSSKNTSSSSSSSYPSLTKNAEITWDSSCSAVSAMMIGCTTIGSSCLTCRITTPSLSSSLLIRTTFSGTGSIRARTRTFSFTSGFFKSELAGGWTPCWANKASRSVTIILLSPRVSPPNSSSSILLRLLMLRSLAPSRTKTLFTCVFTDADGLWPKLPYPDSRSCRRISSNVEDLSGAPLSIFSPFCRTSSTKGGTRGWIISIFISGDDNRWDTWILILFPLVVSSAILVTVSFSNFGIISPRDISCTRVILFGSLVFSILSSATNALPIHGLLTFSGYIRETRAFISGWFSTLTLASTSVLLVLKRFSSTVDVTVALNISDCFILPGPVSRFCTAVALIMGSLDFE